MNRPRNCLVTGATGVVGAPLVQQLAARGDNVTVLARTRPVDGCFPPSVRIVLGDLADTSELAKAAQDVDCVFHLAAKLHISNPDPALRKEYEETNVAGTRRLLQLARRMPVQKFIFFSTINVYGASEGRETFDETSPLNPISFYGESKASAEQAVLAATNANGDTIGVCLRLAAVYGSRMKGNYLRLLEAVRRGRFFFVGKGQNRRTIVHQSDAARAAILAADKGPGGRIYNVTDGHIHTLYDIVRAMSAALGKSPPRLRVSVAPVRLCVGAMEDAGRIIGVRSPINRTLLAKFLEDTAVSGKRIQDELDFQARYGLMEGWKEAVSSDVPQYRNTANLY